MEKSQLSIILIALGTLWIDNRNKVEAVSFLEVPRSVPDSNRAEDAAQNSQALRDTISDLAASVSHDRELVIPSGSTFYLLNTSINSVHSVTIRLEGTLIAHPSIREWYGRSSNTSARQPVLLISRSHNITLKGGGTFIGNGFGWWAQVFLKNDGDMLRPDLVRFEGCTNILIEGWHVRDAPRYHFYLEDVANVVVREIDISVSTRQRKLRLDAGIPVFPLNTDGIDVAGKNVSIYNCTIENYDDAIAVKPMNALGVYSSCSEDINVSDIIVRFGLGMTIGSVPPDLNTNCVRNVLFQRVTFYEPFKAIYVKSNPGSAGSAIIERVLYQDIVIHKAIWWGIYIGPQQQKQPDGGGPGCMLFPLRKYCPTNPRVTMRSIVLRRIDIYGGELPPGIVRCDPANPCTDFVFDAVQVMNPVHNLSYIVDNVYGAVYNSNPAPSFILETSMSLPASAM